MMAGAATGAPFVLLDEAVAPAGLKAEEIGLELNWRVGPAGYDISGEHFLQVSAEGGMRALLPLYPVHLKAQVREGDLHLSWIRRGRIDADSWLGEDIPLGEAQEAYRIRVAGQNGSIVRTVDTTAPAWIYTATMIAADFPEPPASIDISVSQMSAAVGPGIPARRAISLA